MTTEELIRKTLEAIVEDFNEQIDALGYTASGETAKSWKIEATDTTGTLNGLKSFTTIVQERLDGTGKGAKPKGPPPFQDILDWIQVKGIQGRDKKGRFITHEQFANLVRWSIHHKGTHLYRGLRQGVDMKGIIAKRRNEMISVLGKTWLTKLRTDGIERAI